jgi:hypothetical protein
VYFKLKEGMSISHTYIHLSKPWALTVKLR